MLLLSKWLRLIKCVRFFLPSVKCLFGMIESKYLAKNLLPKREKKSRIFEVDFLRGFDLILMIAVHFCYAASSYGVMGMLFDSSSINNGTIDAMNAFCGNVFGGIVFSTGIANPVGPGVFHLNFLEIFFSGLFIFLCGVSCSFARNNAKRAFQLAYVAELLTVTLITVSVSVKNLGIYGSDNNPLICIICGILQAIAIALLVYSFIDHFFPKFYQTFLFAIGFSIIAITVTYFYADQTGYIYNAKLPGELWKVFLGLGRYGDDYFSPPQVIATLFLGASFGKLFYREKKSLLPDFPTKWAKPILFLGRHSLLIYIVHQPFMYIILFIVYLSLGYKIK